MFPVVFLNLETPLDFVDVNVHPTKQEVHFLDGQSMYAGLLHSVRDMLESSNLERRPDAEAVANAARPVPTRPEATEEGAPRELR
ncbi:hypothetical protein ACP3XN_24460, partial [Salmonella enterica]